MTMFIVNQDYDKLLSSQNYNQLIWIDCVTCTCLSPSNLLLQQQFFQKRIKALKNPAFRHCKEGYVKGLPPR